MLMITNRRIVRWEGALLLVVYAASVALIGPTG
jgi:Ca2+/Na+ antiporter